MSATNSPACSELRHAGPDRRRRRSATSLETRLRQVAAAGALEPRGGDRQRPLDDLLAQLGEHGLAELARSAGARRPSAAHPRPPRRPGRARTARRLRGRARRRRWRRAGAGRAARRRRRRAARARRRGRACVRPREGEQRARGLARRGGGKEFARGRAASRASPLVQPLALAHRSTASRYVASSWASSACVPDGDDLAVAQDEHAVADGEQRRARRDHERRAAGAQLAHAGRDPGLGDRVDGGRRLVQDEHGGVGGERAGERDPLALAARQRAGHARRPARRGRPGAPRRPRRLRPRPAPRRPPSPTLSATLPSKRSASWSATSTSRCAVSMREGVERRAVEAHVAGRAAREHVDERVRLGRVGHDEPDVLARGDLDRGGGQDFRGLVAEILATPGVTWRREPQRERAARRRRRRRVAARHHPRRRQHRRGAVRRRPRRGEHARRPRHALQRADQELGQPDGRDQLAHADLARRRQPAADQRDQRQQQSARQHVGGLEHVAGRGGADRRAQRGGADAPCSAWPPRPRRRCPSARARHARDRWRRPPPPPPAPARRGCERCSGAASRCRPYSAGGAPSRTSSPERDRDADQEDRRGHERRGRGRGHRDRPQDLHGAARVGAGDAQQLARRARAGDPARVQHALGQPHPQVVLGLLRARGSRPGTGRGRTSSGPRTGRPAGPSRAASRRRRRARSRGRR